MPRNSWCVKHQPVMRSLPDSLFFRVGVVSRLWAEGIYIWLNQAVREQTNPSFILKVYFLKLLCEWIWDSFRGNWWPSSSFTRQRMFNSKIVVCALFIEHKYIEETADNLTRQDQSRWNTSCCRGWRGDHFCHHTVVCMNSYQQWVDRILHPLLSTEQHFLCKSRNLLFQPIDELHDTCHPKGCHVGRIVSDQTLAGKGRVWKTSYSLLVLLSQLYTYTTTTISGWEVGGNHDVVTWS